MILITADMFALKVFFQSDYKEFLWTLNENLGRSVLFLAV